MSEATYSPAALRADRPHRVKVTLEIRNEAGEREAVETDVYYRAVSLDDRDAFPAVVGLTGRALDDAVKAQLAYLVLKIPRFGVGPAAEGFEQAADAAFFGALDDKNISAISTAIGDDLDPNAPPSGSSPTTTGAEGK